MVVVGEGRSHRVNCENPACKHLKDRETPGYPDFLLAGITLVSQEKDATWAAGAGKICWLRRL